MKGGDDDQKALLPRDEHGRRDAAGEYPAGGFCGPLWGSPANALALHRHFVLNDTACFLRMSGTSRFFHRSPINFVAISGQHAPWMAQLVKSRESMGHVDEQALTSVASGKYGAVNEIFHGFVVAHASFGKQRSAIDAIVELYKGPPEVPSVDLAY